MFRKCFAAVVALMLVVGGLFADEITGIVKKCEGGKICIEVDGKVQEIKIGDAKQKNKEGKEIAVSEQVKKYKEGDKVTAVVDGGELKQIKKAK